MNTIEFSNYRLLKIPFVSKKKANEILGVNNYSGKYSFSGVAYYLIDITTYCIVWERSILNESEYRPTDNPMLITSHYESYYLNKNIDRKDLMGWSDDDYKVSDANDSTLDKINNYSLHHCKTVLSIEGVVSGSNPTGSDSKPANSPILIDPREEVDYIRFVNAIKHIRCHNKSLDNAFKKVLNDVSDIERVFNNEISLSELINLNTKFGKWMKIINSDIEDINNDQSDISEYINSIDNRFIINSVKHIIAMYETELIEKEKVVSKLRREFRMALLKEAIDNNYKEYTDSDEVDIKDTEAAHILGVKEIKDNGLNLEWIADPNNGLLLSPTTHTILDKHKLFMTEEGDLIPVSKDYEGKEGLKINKNLLNENRKKFIKLRNEYL